MRKLLVVVVLVAAGCGKKNAGGPMPGMPTPGGSTPVVADGDWRPSLAGATIPSRPAAGRIKGEAFTVERAEIENGILHLRQGKEFFADREFVVFLFQVEKGAIPEGKSWDIKDDKEFGHPHIHMGSTQAGEKMPKYDMYMQNYSMKLEFGREAAGKLPGKIWLCVPDAEKSYVVGEFVAEVKGFVLRNGVPDRGNDSLDLLTWLAEEKLGTDNPGHKVAIATTSGGSYFTNAGKGEGSNDVDWTLDGAKKGWLKFRFVKEKNEWRVAGTWPGDQIPEAHPASPPAPADGEEVLVRYLSATQLEKSLCGRVAHVSGFNVSTRKGVAAACMTQVQIEGDSNWAERAWVFKWTDAGWVFDRELGPGERFNSGTGKVESK